MTWPASLPLPSPEGYQEIFSDNAIRSQMSVGPMKVRKRSTAAPKVYRFSFEMTSAQVDTLQTFFSSTIDDGVTTFTMTDPRTSNSKTWRMLGPPEVTAITGTYYRVSVQMEQLI